MLKTTPVLKAIWHGLSVVEWFGACDEVKDALWRPAGEGATC